MSTEAEALQMARASVGEAVLGINPNDHPNYVREIVGLYHGHVREAISAGEQLRADRAELAAKADLILPAGAERLERAAQAEAEHRAKEEMQKARAAVETLRRAALLEALPKVDPARESLGRDELSMIIGTGSPTEVMTRVHQVAQSGSRDSVACLLSPFGRALCESRGLSGADLDGALSSARRVVVESAADKGWHTEAELRSARLYRATGELDAGIAASSFALGHLGIQYA